MSEYNLGTARGVIEIDYRGNGATQASADLRNVGTTADQSAQKMDKAGRGMVVAGAVIAGGLAVAVKSAADFEKQLSNVAAVSGATDAEMEQLRDKSLQLGKDTQFSAAESAGAIEELVKAGLSVQDVMNGAADATVNLAAAGEVSMPEAATIASNAMNQFGLAAEDMVTVADNIAGAANASAIDVSDFGTALAQVGAVAKLNGASFEDTATAIALMGNAGVKGSDAGTSLKSMFANLTPETTKAREAFQQLNLLTEEGASKFYDAEGNMRSLADVSGLLQKGLKGMSDEEKALNLGAIFGSDGIRAASILGEKGAKGFTDMAAAMGKVSAADVAATKMDNLAGSMEQLKGSLETLMIMIGTPLLNGIRGIVDGFTSFLNIVLGLPGPVLEAVTVFLAILSAGLLLVGAFLKIRSAIMLMQAGMLLFTGPILLVIAAIAALVAAFVYFYKTNAKFRAFVQEMGKVIMDAFGKAMEWLIPKLKQFGAFLMQVFRASLPYLKQFGAFLVSVFKAAVPAMQKILPIIQQVGQFLISAFNASLPIIRQVIAFLTELAGIFMDKVVPAIMEAANSIIGALVGAFNKIWPAIQAMIPAIQDFLGSVIGLAQALITRLTPAFNFVVSVIKILARVFMSTILPALIKIGGIFTKVFVTVLGNAIRTALNVVRNVLGIISGVIKVFTGLLTGNWSKAWEGVKQILSGVVGVIISILKGLVSSAGSIIKGLGSMLLTAIKAIPGLLRGAGSLFLAAGKFLMQMFVDGIKNAAGLIQGIATNVWDFVKGLLNGAIGQINAALEFTINPPGPGSVSINPPDIPALAHGGVLTAPTMAWVAEAGEDEAVIPLSQLWRQMEKVFRAGRETALPLELAGMGNGAPAPTSEGRVRGDVHVNVHNPIPERASKSVSSTLRNRVVEAGWSV